MNFDSSHQEDQRMPEITLLSAVGSEEKSEETSEDV